MKTTITNIAIDNELDIVLAHRRAMQIAKFAGINIAGQTRFATAVSEICRNALEFCRAGKAQFQVRLLRRDQYVLEAIITDCGQGIKDLEAILNRNPQAYVTKGRGIVFSKKLVDHFSITTGLKGTEVVLGVDIPPDTPVNNIIVQGWVNFLKNEPTLTAYEELKMRNASLLQLTEELKSEKEKSEKTIIEIKELNEKLAKTNTYLEEFTYTVSHDLRTPLTNLKLSLSFLEEADDQESKTEYIEIISRAAKRLERTIMGLVEILEFQTRKKDSIKKIVLEDFFKEIENEYAHYFSKAISIEHDFMVDEIYYIEPYLNSIFTNLISNSIKYRVTGRPLKIKIATRRKNGMVVFTFSDNAEGIDLEKNSKRLFTPFTRFNDVQEGKGIGLYIVKKMVEHHNGRIEIQSKKGEGTTFIINLKDLPHSERRDPFAIH